MTGTIATLAAGVAGGYLLGLLLERSRLATARREAARRGARCANDLELLGARTASERVQTEQRERQRSGRFLRLSTREITSRRSAAERHGRGLDRQAEELDRREAELLERERQLSERHKEAQRLAAKLVRRRRRTRERLEQRIGSGADTRLQETQKGVVQRIVDEADRSRTRALESISADADQRARWVIGVAVGRCQVSHDHPLPSSLIPLRRGGETIELPPSFDLAGLLERRLAVGLEHDAAQGTLFISHPDGVVREVARRVIEDLLEHELFDDTGVEALVARHQQEVTGELAATGRSVLEQLRLAGVAPELETPLGRLRYRTSFGQNILYHSIEVAYLCAAIGGEVGLDPRIALRAGLFHDIGKVLDHQGDQGHPELGARLLAGHGEPPEVVEAARDHHQPPEKQPRYAALVCAADAISAARPGARRESFDQYVRRLERLEMIANSFFGVETAYAIQAGRELRVLVDPQEVDDRRAKELCAGIAREIKQELEFPGRVKVTLIREKRIVEYAR